MRSPKSTSVGVFLKVSTTSANFGVTFRLSPGVICNIFMFFMLFLAFVLKYLYYNAKNKYVLMYNIFVNRLLRIISPVFYHLLYCVMEEIRYHI